MGLFGKKNKTKDEVEDKAVVDAKAAEKENKKRMKRIEKMCSKFDETVWVSIIDILREEIPDFVTEYEGEKQFVTFALDTSQHPINDFENTKDSDVGQLYNMIKTEMDVILETGLLANELILFIPTEKTLMHMAEYAEEFDFKYKIVLCKNDDDAGDYTVMTYDGTEEPITIEFRDVDSMVAAHNIGASITKYAKDRNYNKEDSLEEEKESFVINKDAQAEDAIDAADIENENVPEEAVDQDKYKYKAGERRAAALASGEAEEEAEETVEDKADEEPESAEAENEEDTAEESGELADVSLNDLTNAVAQASDAAMANEEVKENDTKSLAERVAEKRKARKLNSAVAKAVEVASEDEEVKKQQMKRMQPVNQPQILTVDDIDKFIVRKFYSDDLGLEVSTEPFDAAIVSGNRYQPFEYIPESVTCSEWLNEYINNLRADANTKLLRMHQENITMLREHYVLLVTRHCEDVVKALDLNDPNSKYGAMKITLNQKRKDDSAKLQDRISAEIAKLREEQQKMLNDKIEAAKAAAVNSFNREILPTYEQKEKNIRSVLSTDIEVAYTEGLNAINEARREEAKRQLDIGINEILKNIHDEYAKMLAIEREEYNRLQGIISEFEKSNMAADMAHAQTVQADLDRSNKVAAIQDEYESKLSLMKSEFELKLEAAYEDIRRKNVEYNDQMAKLKEQHDVYVDKLTTARDEEVEKLNGEIASLNEQLRAMSDQYVELDKVTNEKYRNQIDEIKSEREAWEERADHLENMHKHTDRIKITIAIVGIIAAMGIGVIVGASYMANKVTSPAPANSTPQITYHVEDQSANTDADANTETTDDVNDSTVNGGEADE